MRVFSRVEMWCRRQAAAAILPLLLAGWLTGESSEALTTFGKSNTQAPKELAPTSPPGKMQRPTEKRFLEKNDTNTEFWVPLQFRLVLDKHWKTIGNISRNIRSLFENFQLHTTFGRNRQKVVCPSYRQFKLFNIITKHLKQQKNICLVVLPV